MRGIVVTAYFDAKATELRAAADLPDHLASEAIDLVEETVVRDVTICVEMPGCPSRIRDSVHRIIVARAVVCLPRGKRHPGFDTVQEHTYAIGSLCEDLHTTFHRLGSLCLDRFSDDPLRPLRNLCDEGEELREKMLSAQQATLADERSRFLRLLAARPRPLYLCPASRLLSGARP